MIAEVRQFLPEEWPLFRKVRLKALEEDPAVFSATREEAETIEHHKWQADLSSPDLAVFGVFDEGKLIGMTGIAVKRKNDPEGQTAVLWGSWLEPEYRGKGISAQMYQARINWARHHPDVKRIVVSHRASNNVSRKANQKHGFFYTHTLDGKLWPDGKIEPEVFYELRVKD